MTWKQAWRASPGPATLSETVVVALKGFCMGSADIIPGVSGGTIAFITGIYSQLVAAIRSFDAAFVKNLFGFRPKDALAGAHLRFLAPLLLGIGAAIMSMARIMHHMLTNHPVEIWSLFFGLIAASILVVGRRVDGFGPVNVAMAVLGAAASYLIVGLIPVQTPEAFWFLFLSGAMAICAMILPGISGAFILLILGKYEFITRTLKNPFLADNLLVIAVFCAGCLAGIVAFSRVLDYFLTHRRAATISLLTGFMIGAMRKVWPWKEVLQSAEIGSKTYALVERNVPPPAYDAAFFLSVGLMAAGFAAVILLEWLSNRESGPARGE